MAPDPSIPTRTVVLGSVRKDGSLVAAEVYALANACGMTDLQVRLCLRRLVSEGALEHVGGRGKRAEYVARGESAARILPELEYVEFAYRQDAGQEPWDGRWRLVGFSIPEHRRAARDELRDRLRYFGGAPVHGGLYASPHAWGDIVAAEAERIGVTETLTLIECDRLGLGGVTEPRELAARLWPLTSVARGYREFMQRLARRMEQARAGIDPAALGGDVFAASVDFARTIEPDPLLPPELLPDPWAGTEARRMLADAQRTVAGLGFADRLPALYDRLAVPAAADGDSAGGR